MAPPETEIQPPVPVPRLLVELPSRFGTFQRNLRDLVFRHRLPELELSSAPGEFWPDVFIDRPLPWTGFLQSGGYHVLALAALIGLTHLFALQPRVVTKPAFDHSQVVYYDASDTLPPLDTLTAPAAPQPQKADPEVAKQPIISVPPEADNRSQTIVTPPKVRLKRDVPMPNIVAWSDTERPQLEIPAAPLTPAAEINRMAPKLDGTVVAPPQDTTRLAQRRTSMALQSAVVAPPPELQASKITATFPGLQPSLIAPPPTVETSSARALGDLNIGRSAVIAPSPQLPVAEQRSLPGGSLRAGLGKPAVIAPAPQLTMTGQTTGQTTGQRSARGSLAGAGSTSVVPPPPSASGSGLTASSGRGRVIALNLHPAVGAPPDPPAGNRRGNFAATPSGHAGASGSASSTSGGGNGVGSGSAKKSASDLPSGLYVGGANGKASPVAGDSTKTAPTSVNPTLVATARRPRVTSAPTRAMQPESAAKLTEPERAVFAGRKFYSVTLNMPNLNSAGGSWVIRFAELNHAAGARDANAPAADLSQPMATKKVDPAYPTQLMRENVSGTVILYAVIHADGTVGNVRVLRGVDERLDRYASEAVVQWKFDPATKNGTPVDVEATFQIPFRPAKVGTNF